MENNKIKVKIYGQEYIITGEKDKEEIVKIAAHVDMKMDEISKLVQHGGLNAPNVAVLSAVNIASEYFQLLDEIDELNRVNGQLEKDAQHYVQLWDETKKNYIDYKEETQTIVIQKEDLLNKIRTLEEDNNYLKEELAAAKEATQNNVDEIVSEVEAKCKELENSFFDLQMENLRLKKEVEKHSNDTL